MNDLELILYDTVSFYFLTVVNVRTEDGPRRYEAVANGKEDDDSHGGLVQLVTIN